jgi:hypothetical protein
MMTMEQAATKWQAVEDGAKRLWAEVEAYNLAAENAYEGLMAQWRRVESALNDLHDAGATFPARRRSEAWDFLMFPGADGQFLGISAATMPEVELRCTFTETGDVD